MQSFKKIAILLIVATPTFAQKNSTGFFQFTGKPLDGEDLCSTKSICNQAYMTTNSNGLFQTFDSQLAISRTKLENSSSESGEQEVDACLTLKMLGFFIEGVKLQENFSQSEPLVTCNMSMNVRGWQFETQVTHVFSNKCLPLNTKINTSLQQCSFLKKKAENKPDSFDKSQMITVFVVIGAFVGMLCVLGLIKECGEECGRRNLPA